MSFKSDSRLRRAGKTRIRISQQDKPRLSVFKSSKNMYAQVFDSKGSKVVVSASTNEKTEKIKSNQQNWLDKKLLKELSKLELKRWFLIDQVINIMVELKQLQNQPVKLDWSSKI